jgi:hypothetical protein
MISSAARFQHAIKTAVRCPRRLASAHDGECTVLALFHASNRRRSNSAVAVQPGQQAVAKVIIFEAVPRLSVPPEIWLGNKATECRRPSSGVNLVPNQ